MKAVIFPGQGAQYVGMGKSLYDNYSESKAIFDQMDELLGFKLSQKCFLGSEEELKGTDIQQLAILSVSLAAYEAFKDKCGKVDYFSGLSLGEYSCLYAAGVISLKNLTLLVKERATAMAKAAVANPATMFAVMNVDQEELKRVAKENGFYISNLNSPSQTVVSLGLDDKDKVKSILEAKDAKVIELPVSGGFHSPFMAPAKERLAEVVSGMEFFDATVPVISNFTAKAHTKSQEIKANLIEQLVSSVLWNDCVGFMIGSGVEQFYEVGPGKILRGLMRKIDKQAKVVNIEKAEDLISL